MKFVAVTACPTGIAHSQMAAEALETAAAESTHEVTVEVQGGMGVENELSADAIADADAAIVAADVHVESTRFEDADLPVLAVPVGDAIGEADRLLDDAANLANGDPVDDRGSGAADAGLVERVRRWLG